MTGSRFIEDTQNSYKPDMNLIVDGQLFLTKYILILYKSNNCTLTIYKFKPIKKVIILNSKHKSVKINNDRKPKLNSASISPIKWQEFLQEEKENLQGISSGQVTL
ncbi:piggyBac transposable element-derived protein 4-like [Vespula maculifrons]|uniref:PiggyBac transposable element-derived protein 4-like n=1 Tax=Vespula maculifrons TaxID=7453 RepID=A0ABD2CU76_VESMC